MTPLAAFAIEQIWRTGRLVKVAEKGSTLGLLIEATALRIIAAVTSPTGCPCCRCSIPIRCTTDLQSVTVAVGHSDVEEFRVIVRVYCARCAPDPDTLDAMAACEYGAVIMRFRVRIPASKAWKPVRRPVTAAA